MAEIHRGILARKIEIGWAPARCTVTDLLTSPLPHFRREHVWSSSDLLDIPHSNGTITEVRR